MSTEITVVNDIIEINVTEEPVIIEAPSGAYPLPTGVYSVYGRTGNVVAQDGDYTLTLLGDVTIVTPSNGQVLRYNGTAWVNSTESYVGTVTSVAASVPTGLTIAGSPITTSGTLAFGLQTGYSIPTTASQTTWDTAYNRSLTSAAVTGTTTKTLTLNQQSGGTITASWTDDNTDAVTSVFGRTGAVVAVNGDYTTSLVTEGTNLYYTDVRARASNSFVAGSGGYNSTTGVITIPTNNNQITNGAAYITLTGISATTPLNYNNTTGVFTISQSNTSTNGYLSSTDWNTFNNKEAAITAGTITQYYRGDKTFQILDTSAVPEATNLYYTQARFDTAFSNKTTTNLTEGTNLYYTDTRARAAITGTSPISVTSGVVSISQSNTSTNGYLSFTDWNTFNGKQNALNGTGFVKISGTTISYDNSTYLTTIEGITAGGELSGTYASPSLVNSAVIGKVLTGVNITGGTIAATDSILTAFGKVQNQINGLIGGSIYQGTWNANTNTPTLTSSVGTSGYYYIVSVAGTTNLNGIADWQVGDWAIFNGGVWQKVDNTDAVVSVNGFTGAVSLSTSNINEGSNLYFTNARTIASTLTGYTSGAGTITSSDTILTAIQKLNGNIGSIVSGVSSVFGRTGAVVSNTGDYTTSQVTEGSNLYFTDTRARAAISLTTTGTSGAATYVSGVLNIPNYGSALTGYVPYTGATQDVDLGAFKLNAQSLHAKGTGGLGHLGLKHQSASATASANEVSLFADSNGDLSWLNGNLYLSKFITSGNTANRSYTFPNATGTIALTSDISYPVTSVYGRTGAVVATSGDYTTTQVTEGTNLYYTDTRARASLSFVAGSGAYNSTTGVITIPTNNTQITNGSNYITLASLSATSPLSYNNTTGAFTIAQATTSTSGYLSSTDWNTFNGKQAALTNPVTLSGSITTNYHTKWTGTNTIGNSLIWDNGTNVGIGNTNTSYTLDVSGTGRFTGLLTAGAGVKMYYGRSDGRFFITDEANYGDMTSTTGMVSIGYYPAGQEATIRSRNYSTSTNTKLAFDASQFYFAGGNVGIGTSSPNIIGTVGTVLTILGASTTNGGTLELGSNNLTSTTGEMGKLEFLGLNGSGSVNSRAIIVCNQDGTTTSSNMRFFTMSAGTIAERMRITNGGGVRINTTATGTSNPQLYVYNADGGRLVATFEVGIVSDGFTAISFANNNGQKGSIAINSNSTTYNTTSDYRLKHDLKDFNALDKVSKIKIYDFAWESNGERNDGVMAHELQEVIPYAVNGKKDAVNEDGSIKPQGVDYSMIVPTLVKAIQELSKQNEELSNRLIKLESK
jgi:hypothetical protein